MVYLLLFVLVLVLLKLYYFKNLSIDVIVLTISVLVLVLFALRRSYLEKFDQDSQQIDTRKIKFLNNLLSDTATTTPSKSTQAQVNSTDLAPISDSLQMYVTTYSSASYSGYGTTWYNISQATASQQQATCQGDVVGKDLQFEDDPVFDGLKGLYLGPIALKGPPSYNLGINGNGTFTVFFICQYDALSDTAANVFRIYGNSDSNDGLSVNVQQVQTSPTQSGVFALSYAGVDYVGSRMVMDPNIVYLYTIVKTQNAITMSQLSSVNSTPVPVLSTSLTTSEVLFSNKKMTFNSYLNWNAYLKAFGTYNYSMSSVDVKNLYDYMMMEEKKMDALYQQQQTQISTLNQSLSNLQGCPFNTTTCKACTSVSDWTNHQNIITSSQTCRTAIDAYCTTNTSNQYCVCWDSNNAAYSTPECVHWRSIFSANAALPSLSNLDATALAQLKQQYNLREVEINLTEDPVTGQLQTLDISQLPNDLVTNFNITATAGPSTMPYNINGAGSSNATIAGSANVVAGGSPQIQYIPTPVAPTPKGFYEWATSWF